MTGSGRRESSKSFRAASTNFKRLRCRFDGLLNGPLQFGQNRAPVFTGSRGPEQITDVGERCAETLQSEDGRQFLELMRTIEPVPGSGVHAGGPKQADLVVKTQRLGGNTT